MRRRLFLLIGCLCLLALSGISLVSAQAQTVPTPEQFYGFKMGADGELAHWNKITEYFQLLDARSDRLTIQNLGKTTLGNPFLLAIFSSPENLKNLEKYRAINLKLADPRGLSAQEIEGLIKEGKSVVAISHSLHATEVGATQGTSELAYELVTSDDPTIRLILDNTIFLMIPCFNPDGQIMVTDWFYKYKNTQYGNTQLPYLYHFYSGHDDNRDGYMLNLAESRLFAKAIYRDWIPEVYVDHHQMGGPARYYIPPFVDPIHPNVSPLIWLEHQVYGAQIAIALDRGGKSGIESGVGYEGWVQSLYDNTGNYHNIASMLTESANANWANPVYVMPDQLEGWRRGRPGYFPQMSMPRLWPGGWWHLRDIVEQQLIASKAVLETAARHREATLRTMVLKAQENIKQGLAGPPYAYIIPKDQHDFPTAVRLVQIFQQNGVEIQVLNKPYRTASRVFEPGSYVISCAQPMRVFVKSFLEQVNYPDNAFTRDSRDGSPLNPYDWAVYAMNEFMGVDAIPALEPLQNADMTVVKGEVVMPKGTVTGTGTSYLLSHDSTESFKAVNQLLANGYQVAWAKAPFSQQNRTFPAGTMIVSGGTNLASFVTKLANELGLNFSSAPASVSGGQYTLKSPRIGLYKRFAGGSQNEGWTNWLLQDFGFPFKSLFNKDIKDPQLAGQYDVIIIPSENTVAQIVNGRDGEDVPPEYRGGIGKDGTNNIKEFVEKGGTLITENDAWEFAARTFGLPIENSDAGVATKDFWCPGSTLKINVDTSQPLAYGMPANALALFLGHRGSPVLSVSTGPFGGRINVAARYQEENILQSGWLIGERYLSKKPAVLEFGVGKGKVIILAFGSQQRAETHGTFKFLFNAIYYGPAATANP